MTDYEGPLIHDSFGYRTLVWLEHETTGEACTPRVGAHPADADPGDTDRADAQPPSS